MSSNVTATLMLEEAGTGPGRNVQLIAGVFTAIAVVLAVGGFLIFRLLIARARCKAVARDAAGDEGSTGLRRATSSLFDGILLPKKLESVELEQIVSTRIDHEDPVVPEAAMDLVSAEPHSDTVVIAPHKQARLGPPPIIPILANMDSQNTHSQVKRLSLILLPENFYSSANDTLQRQQQQVENSIAGESFKRLDLAFVKKATERRAYEHDHPTPLVSLSEQATPELTQPPLAVRTSSLPPRPRPPPSNHRSPKLQSLIAPPLEKQKADMAKRRHIARMRLTGEEVEEVGLSGSPLRQEILVAGDA
ncbi:hypothetical protein BC830DRAFT_1084550 [Chytriomyces sp. MP71]|nr:hypothetical protein BC830DRAFT_1084550 [Chytriomyces sp. MP71]